MSLVQSLHHVVALSLDQIRNQNGYIARTLTAGTRDGFVFELPLFAETEKALQLPAERTAADLLAALKGVLTYADPHAVPGCLENEPLHKAALAAVTKAEARMSAQRIAVSVAGQPQFECSLGEFLDANGDALEAEQIHELTAALSRGEAWRDGGGAAPMYEIRVA